MIAGPSRLLVVTPTLGRSEFLDRSVASVAALPLELVHVISAPAERCQLLQRRFPRASVIADAGKAVGLYGALNRALEDAPGGWDWFTYINDDDALLPGFAEVARRHPRRPAPEAVAYGDVELIDGSDRRIARVTIERDPAWFAALLQQGISPLMQQGMLFSRETVRRLGGFDTRYRLCADLDFWLRAYAAGSRFLHYPARVAQFRIHRGQLSGDTEVTRREQDQIVRSHLPAPISQGRKRWALWRYRAENLPRYMARILSRGPKTSYQLLQGGASRP